MNFCQNHHNHHCIHAHDCQNPTHKKKCKKVKEKNNKNKEHAERQVKLSQIIQEKDQCDFVYSRNPQQESTKKIVQLQNAVEALNIKISELAKLNAELNKKYDKSDLENRHLVGQVEYYRSQFDRLIKNNTQDIKIQIKRHLKQNSELIMKVRSLNGLIIDIQKDKEPLMQQNKELKIQNQQLRRKLRQLEKHYEKTQLKLKLLYNENLQNKDKNLSSAQFIKKYQEKNRIVIEESQNIINELTKQNNYLKNKIKQVQNQISKLKSQNNKELELQKIQFNSLKDINNQLLEKIKSLQKSNSRLKQKQKDQRQKNIKFEQQMQHAKNVIKKQLQVIEKSKDKQQKDKEQQNNSQISEQERHNKNSYNQDESQKENIRNNIDIHIKEGENYTNRQRQLLKENNILKQKLKIIEQKVRIQVKQQYILMMGASEQLKKILDQKNIMIKKLLKEKSELMLRITP